MHVTVQKILRFFKSLNMSMINRNGDVYNEYVLVIGNGLVSPRHTKQLDEN